MPHTDRPRELPARLLTDPEMISACRARDFGVVFRLMKVRAGIHPSMIARRCQLTPSRVSAVITGQRHLAYIDVIERIADGLCIPGHMLGLARRPWETPGPLLAAERQEPQSQDRQEAASLPSPDVDSILALAADARLSLSASTLDAFRSSIEDYWRRDDQHGGEALRPAIVGQLRHVVGLLRDNPPATLRAELYAIAAELAHLTGWTYFDACQYSQARTYLCSPCSRCGRRSLRLRWGTVHPPTGRSRKLTTTLAWSVVTIPIRRGCRISTNSN